MSRIWNTQAIHPYTNQHPFINSTPLRCTNPNICSYPHSHPFYTRIRPQPADPSNPFCPTAVGSRSSPASSEHSSVYHGHLHYHSELEQPGNGECSRPQLHQCSRLCLVRNLVLLLKLSLSILTICIIYGFGVFYLNL